MKSGRMTLARPYAKAAFAFASEANQLENWNNWLGAAILFVSDPQVEHSLLGHVLSKDRVAEIFKSIFQDIVDASFINFIDMLAERNRLKVLSEIHQLFVELKIEYEGKIAVFVESAYELTDEQLNRLKIAIEKKTGKQALLSTNINESLLGGAIVRMKDWVFDNTARSRFECLIEHLNKK